MTQHSDLPADLIPDVTEGEAYAAERQRVVYRITYHCGHTSRRAFYGTPDERQQDLEHAQLDDCFACEHDIWALRDRMLGSEFMTGKDLS